MSNNEQQPNIVSTLIQESLRDNNEDLIKALEAFIETYKRNKEVQQIPLGLFSNRKLGVLEITVKYLKENKQLSYHDIAQLLKRDDRTVWSAYSKAIKKQKEPFSSQTNDQIVDVAIFSDRTKAPLKALIEYLRKRGMSYRQIAEALNRDYKTVWLTYKRKS